MRHLRAWLAFAAVLASVARADAPAWPGDFTGRLAALALIRSAEAEILSAHSATATLETWCRDHRLAEMPRIQAVLIPGDRAPDLDQLAVLQAGTGESVKHRRVELRCGDRLLSVADTWYLPSRLTPEMNRLLETTDTPFGTAVAPLGPDRQTLSAHLLWSPLPQHWENVPNRSMPDEKTLALPDGLFEIAALLHDRDRRPIALVDETYQKDLLGFPPPQ